MFWGEDGWLLNSLNIYSILWVFILWLSLYMFSNCSSERFCGRTGNIDLFLNRSYIGCSSYGVADNIWFLCDSNYTIGITFYVYLITGNGLVWGNTLCTIWGCYYTNGYYSNGCYTIGYCITGYHWIAGLTYCYCYAGY